MAEILLYELLTTLPFHLFAYVPFWQSMRFSKRVTIWLLAAIEVLYLSVAWLLAVLGVSHQTLRLASLPIFGGFFFLLVKESPGKIAFLYAFTADYTMAVHAAVLYLQFLFPEVLGSTYSVQSGLLVLALFLISLPLMLHFFLRTAQRILAIKAPDIWKFIWLLPIAVSATIIAATYYREGTPDVGFLLSRFMLIICMFLIYYNVIQLVNQTLKQMEDAEHIRHLEQIATVQADQYQLIQSRIEEARRARHDLRQLLRAIQGYIDIDDIPGLSAYIKSYGDSLPSDSVRVYSRNLAVDAVLRFYAEKASSAGIDINISFSAGEIPVIPEPELCVLLGNLLENALENCSSANGHPFIRMRAVLTEGRALTLTVDNSCTQPPVLKDGHLLSRKHGGPGIGTESIRIISEKYQGFTRFEWKDDVFFTSVLLNLAESVMRVSDI